jgi:hypothetical protein
MELTPYLVRGLWAHLSQTYHSTVLAEPDSAEMRVAAKVLEGLGIVDGEKFLAEYATTIGHRIYVPFVPGVFTRTWTAWGQLTTGVHEHVHVTQFDDHGALPFTVRYLTSLSGRAMLEVEALRTNLELHYWRFGTLPNLDHMAANALRGYGLRPADIEVAQRVLELSAESISRGAITSRVTKTAIQWLERNAPRLRAHGPSA